MLILYAYFYLLVQQSPKLHSCFCDYTTKALRSTTVVVMSSCFDRRARPLGKANRSWTLVFFERLTLFRTRRTTISAAVGLVELPVFPDTVRVCRCLRFFGPASFSEGALSWFLIQRRTSAPFEFSHTPSEAKTSTLLFLFESPPCATKRQFTSGRAVMYGACRLYGKNDSKGVFRYASPRARVTAKLPATRLIPPLMLAVKPNRERLDNGTNTDINT